MSFIDGLRHRLRVWTRRAEYDRALDDEMRFHLELMRRSSRRRPPKRRRQRAGDSAMPHTCARRHVGRPGWPDSTRCAPT